MQGQTWLRLSAGDHRGKQQGGVVYHDDGAGFAQFGVSAITPQHADGLDAIGAGAFDIVQAVADAALQMLDVDRLGFDLMDRNLNESLETSLLERLATMGELAVHHHRGFWQCMDTLRETQLLNDLWNSGAAPWRIWS